MQIYQVWPTVISYSSQSDSHGGTFDWCALSEKPGAESAEALNDESVTVPVIPEGTFVRSCFNRINFLYLNYLHHIAQHLLASY